MRGLLGKELKQHGVLFLFVILILAGGFLLIAAIPSMRAGGGIFFALQIFLKWLLPLACLTLGQALVVTEFRNRTQLFVEALPCPRWKMLFVKYGLGLALMLLSAGLLLLLAWWQTHGAEAMTPRFASLLVLKSAAWVWFIYALCFAFAFLGRYRVALFIFAIIMTASLPRNGDEFSNFGPFKLLDEQFSFERVLFPPTEALWDTAGIILVLTLLAFGLGLMRDGMIASLMAEKMSSREKTFMAFLVLAGLMGAGYVHDHLGRATPLTLPGAIEECDGCVQVYATAAADAPTAQEAAQLTNTARDTAAGLAALAAYLRWDSLPPFFIVHRRDLAANDFQKGDIEPSQGLMVRLNLTAPGFDPQRLQEWVTHQILAAGTHELAARERNAWVLDGFSIWWPHRGESSESWRHIAAAAQKALPADFDDSQLHRWYSLRKERGEKDTSALAAVGVATLARLRGEEACRQFLIDSFSRGQSVDARDWLRDVLDPIEARLRRAHLPVDDFLKEWREATTRSSP